jgi:hypothetical protein
MNKELLIAKRDEVAAQQAKFQEEAQAELFRLAGEWRALDNLVKEAETNEGKQHGKGKKG